MCCNRPVESYLYSAGAKCAVQTGYIAKRPSYYGWMVAVADVLDQLTFSLAGVESGDTVDQLLIYLSHQV